MKKNKFTRGKRVLALLSATALMLGVLSGCGTDNKNTGTPGAEQKQEEDIVASFPPLKLPYEAKADHVLVEYKDGKLTAGEFEDFLRVLTFINPPQGYAISTGNQEMIENYARQYIVTKQKAALADDAMKKTANEEAEKAYATLKEQYIQVLGGEDKYEQLMKNHNVKKDEVVKQLAEINASVAVLEKEVPEAEVKKTYDSMSKESRTFASVRHILYKFEGRTEEEALKLANEATAKLKKGEDFATLAKQVSEDEGSKQTGGLYPDASVDQWVPEFKAAAMAQKIGEISEKPVRTDYGYHVIKVENRVEKTYDDMKDQLRQQVLEKNYLEIVTTQLDKEIIKKDFPKVTPAEAPANPGTEAPAADTPVK
ncbi:peptidylprolyl isomerase [Brevibacillus daliensis]|uniref:peptidylprolyl isomerase n=1 Tax=Brevibacillus daliensis TaxID=2892995 RepID=UPI001E35F3C4|nr:peptidylprolyl isomerase [Brevibacillus daliensis]